MPLLDHFHPPLHPLHSWESFHSNWATRLADGLADVLPPGFVAEENVHGGPGTEIDVATYEETAVEPRPRPNGAPAATVASATWAPPAPARTMRATFPDSFEVRVLRARGGLTLVAAIELISPGNKDRAEERRAFAIKCASYLHQGVSLILVDTVTSRRANLHNEIMRLMSAPDDMDLPADRHLYAVAYRPVLRKEKAEVDLWTATFAVGDRLPLMPLRLSGDLFVPVDFEAAYAEACRRRHLP
jgi:hypothetical protein